MTTLARELATPAATHVEEARVVVVGSGAAGLSAALRLGRAGIRTLVLTRAGRDDTATAWAQGGLAAVWDPSDSAAAHHADTMVAGAGLNDPTAVADLVREAPPALRRLIADGAQFDRDAKGRIDLHLEGGHHARRILHAGGDASGAEVQRVLGAACAATPAVELREGWRLVDLLTDADGACCGVRALLPDGSVAELRSAAVVLATGGIGQAWATTSNPPTATGDGIATALRAGAEVRDIEFVQFHPTLLHLSAAQQALGDGRGVLISEAVRGEGATLIDASGSPVMRGRHPLGDLAPRDVVASAIQERMVETSTDCVFLDATAFGAARWERQFPSILALCRERGVDPVAAPVPVRPGAHYLCGGIAATLDGVTSVRGLYAIGEVAATGVQGANRLASNSITEGLVTGERVAELLLAALTEATPGEPVARGCDGWISGAHRDELRTLLDRDVAVRRDADGLGRALATLAGFRTSAARTADDLDLTNLHTVATLVTTAALARTESRGCHRRADHPESSPAWLGRQALRLDSHGLHSAWQPLTSARQDVA